MKEMISIMLMKVRDKKGATAIEYGLMAGLIAIAIIIAVSGVGTALNTVFTTVSGKLTAAPMP